MFMRGSFRNRSKAPGPGHQGGVTLIEALIGLALSLVVTSSMVALMSNSMGSATRIIQMSQLTDELRNAMSMMTRDVRRANYNPNATYCFANSDCATDGTAPQGAGVTVPIASSETCFTFALDRNWNGDATDDGGGAFRRREVAVTKPLNPSRLIGQIEMWTGDDAPDCTENIDSTAKDIATDDWIAVTDPEFVDVTLLAVARPIFDESIEEEGGSLSTKRVFQVQIQVQGELLIDNRITRRVEDTIKVRNDLLL
jgi:type II secretory pathway pseudopilin PulG